jgi:putative ABC transport system substrate-binding protein
MKKGKLLTLLPLAAMLLIGCNGQNNDKFNIGICQLLAHPALDKATEGFIKAVEDGLGKENVTFDRQEAAGDPAICSTIANSFVSKKVDLIMANATPAVQAAYNSTATIPILGTSVTEYGVALNIKDFNGTVGGNVSGTSDLAPLDGQADMVAELFPEAKKVGLLYCSAEANSKYQIDKVEGFLKEKNLETKRITFSETNELQSVLTAGIVDLDVLYIPTDNKCADNVTIIDAVCRPAKLPVICGEEGICKGCGVATLSIDYFNLGIKTGQMAVEILKDKKDISKMAIAYDENPVKKFNKAIAEELNITVPASYTEIQ